MRDLLRRSRHFTYGFTDEKALYTGSTWGQLVELFCIQCVVSLSPAGRRNVAYYRTTHVSSRGLSSVRP